MSVTQHADESRQDIDLIHRFSTSTFVRVIAGVLQIRGALQPMTLAIYIDARFIHVQQGAVRELVLDPTIKFFQLVKSLTVEVMDCSSAKWHEQLVSKVIAYSIIRNEAVAGKNRLREF